MRALDAVLIAVAGLCAVSAGAVAWRAASDDALEDDRTGIAIAADYVAQCQTMTAPCYAAADAAMAGRVRPDCLSGPPGRHAMARGALIWLNAHVEQHPRPVADGIARAVAAAWPRCKA